MSCARYQWFTFWLFSFFTFQKAEWKIFSIFLKCKKTYRKDKKNEANKKLGIFQALLTPIALSVSHVIS